ncbi:hypothetical protein FD755_024214 [Muntiacus reevesi]|uniref:Immunoglobulin subtype domain-containing protein n=1 Tax=Muntiacus reevesi TaxID=9886 RepID=A0A5N3VB21_MUNRE|nr:hypothetical protein FD755_024214 [Muntiacus reevesi]
MSSSPGLVTVILLMLGQTHGNSVTQMDGQVTLSEGTSVTINCTYSTSGSMRKEATYNTETTSFHLEKASVQESDSAVCYCALGDTVTEIAGGAEHKF